jgi:glycerophosphoryl diester phosphodiesterase
MARRILAAVVLFAAAAPAVAQSHFAFFEPIRPPRPIQVMAHRGMAMAAPENSLAAVEMCAQDYVEWAEVDVRLTKDGRHVVIHNDTVDSTTDGTGKVGDLTFDELKQLDAGALFARRFQGTRLQSLAEMLTAAKGKVNLYLDCKRIDPELLAKEILAAGMGPQVIVYDRPEVLAKVDRSAKLSPTPPRLGWPLPCFLDSISGSRRRPFLSP